MSRAATRDALELAAALENQGRALLAHAAKLRKLAGEGAVPRMNGAPVVASGTWLDAAAMIERTGVPLGQVYRLARQGGLGAVRCGARAFPFGELGLAKRTENGGAR